MTRIGKYLQVLQAPDNPGRKTHVWFVYNFKGHILGRICWKREWRQYVFDSGVLITLSSGCLDDISRFLQEQNAAHHPRRKG